MRKIDCYAFQNSSYLCCIITQKTVLSLETSSEINFEFIKFVKKGKCLPFDEKQIGKEYYREGMIITFPELIFSTITQSENVIFILLYHILDPLFSTILGLPW